MAEDKKIKKGPNLQFVEFWSLGMNDFEIARQFGVDISTVRNVKKDLNKN